MEIHGLVLARLMVCRGQQILNDFLKKNTHFYADFRKNASKNDEILNCILNDHTFSPIVFGIIAVIGAFVVFRLWKLKKKKFKRF